MNAQLQPLMLGVHCNHSLKRCAWKTGRYHRGVSTESRGNEGIANPAISEAKQTERKHAVRIDTQSFVACLFLRTQTLIRNYMFTVNRG